MKTKVIVAALVVTMLVPVLYAAEDVVLVGNPSIKELTLTEKEIKKIFLGKKIAWDDRTKIVIALQKAPAVHSAFLIRYIHQSPSMFANLWKRQVFTGKVASPKYLPNNQEMIRFISETKGAIGYVSSGTNVDAVKTFRLR